MKKLEIKIIIKNKPTKEESENKIKELNELLNKIWLSVK